MVPTFPAKARCLGARQVLDNTVPQWGRAAEVDDGAGTHGFASVAEPKEGRHLFLS